MSISRNNFNDERFFKERSTKRQINFLKFLIDNKDKAFTTRELAKEMYGDESDNSIAKAYFVLKRLSDKGMIEKKMPYWAIKEKEE